MVHSFDVDIAKKVGVNAAIILWHMYFWCEKNRANERHFHDGLYWTYNSVKAFRELFPYMSRDQIHNAIRKLEDAGFLKEGNYNSSSYDRTKWYALTEAGWEVCKFRECNSEITELHLLKTRNGITENPKPIPDNINTDINTDKESDKSDSMPHLESVAQQVKQVLAAWNEMAEATGMSQVKKILPESERYRMLRARLAEYGIDDVLRAIENVKAGGSYLAAQHWFDFGWFVRPNNFPKVLEGKYGKATAAKSRQKDVPKRPESGNDIESLSEEEYEKYFKNLYGDGQ